MKPGTVSWTIIASIMLVVLFVLVNAIFGVFNWPTSDIPRNALLDAGYKDVTLTGYTFFGCDEKDWYHAGFTAEGPSGRIVAGVVCGSPWKGATIRLN